MKKQSNNKKIKIISGLILLITLNFNAFSFIQPPMNESSSNLLELKSSGVFYDIVIDDLPGSLTNWSWAETQPWFGGGYGTSGDPYIIEDHTFEFSTGSGDCFNILNSRKDFIINNCTFKNSGGTDEGLYLFNTTNGQITNNQMVNNYRGLYLNLCNDTLISDNQVYDNNYYGILLANSHFNNIYENNVSLNSNRGIRLYQSTFNTISENNVCDNGVWDGIQLYNNSNNNTVSRNTVSNSGVQGIEILTNSLSNIITRNTIINHAVEGIHINIGCNYNLLYENIMKNNTVHAVDDGSNNDWNNSLIGNYWDNYIGYDMDLDGIGDDPYCIAGIAGNFDYLPIWNRQASIAIDDLPTSLTNWSWAETQPWFGGGSGTELDPYVLQDFNIESGGGTGNCLSIENSRKHFIVKECSLSNSGTTTTNAGIYLSNVTNALIIDNDCTNNYNGIYLTDSHNNDFSSNTVFNNPYVGIWGHHDNDNNTFYDNTITDSQWGIAIEDGDNNIIQNNNVTDGISDGIILYGFGNDCVIDNNYVKDSGVDGIRLDYFDNCTISHNTIMGSGSYGLNLDFASNSLVFENYFIINGNNAIDNGVNNDWNNTMIGNYWDDYTGYDMNFDGIGDDPYSIAGGAVNFDYLPIWDLQGPIAINDLPGSLNNWTWAASQPWCSGSGTELDPYVIENLKIHGNSTHSCINIQNSNSYFVVDYCELNNSNNRGIYLSNVTNGKLTNNILYNNSYGISLNVDCDFNIISQNIVYENRFQGIRLDYSNNNTISGNTLNNNGRTSYFHGLGVYSSDGNLISNNIANDNNVHGIRIHDSEFNTLTGNTLENNGDGGISVDYGSHHNTLLQNTACNNTNYGIYIEGSSFNIISENTASGNALRNFYILNSNYTTLYRNIADGISDYGIYLENSDFNDIIECEVYNVLFTGISLFYCNNNTISNNTAMYNWFGLFTDYSNENTFSENTFNNNTVLGMCVQFSYGNKILRNTANFNLNTWGGILLSNSHDTLVQDNTAIGNNPRGIGIIFNSYSNNATGNIIKENAIGMDIDSISHNNLVYENFFLKNGIHAVDDGSNNDWNSTTIGNYWDNHTGPDTIPPYGIVDTQYNISGSTGSIDYLPIAEDGSPSIIINSPSEDNFFGASAPSFSVTISDDFLDDMWYTLDGGLHNYTFTGFTGTINQSAWESIADGVITLIFYASDIPGNIGSAEVNIEKDSHGPLIIISSPNTDEIFGASAPSFMVEISDDNLDSMWYSLDGGTTNFLFTTNGTINQAAWSALAEGSVTITFYANDTLGNLESESVDVVKSLPPPDDNFIVIIIIVISIVAGVAVLTVVLLLRRRKAGV